MLVFSARAEGSSAGLLARNSHGSGDCLEIQCLIVICQVRDYILLNGLAGRNRSQSKLKPCSPSCTVSSCTVSSELVSWVTWVVTHVCVVTGQI
jgi:hypothetical protein